ncbi:MAG: methyltransferase [Candidatus Hodarchaeales archaeon]|jgi:methylase of polypeptide subunit release factors
MNHRDSFQLKAHPEVYSPNEDSWFLAETVKDFILEERYVPKINTRILFCEVGIGSGYISIFLTRHIHNLRIFGTDISQYAVSLAFENMKKWIPDIEFNLYQANLMNCFDTRKFKPDIIFFNPPYVRTSLGEVNTKHFRLQRSWAGGPEGITIIQKFLKELESFCFQKAFFLSSSQNSNEKFLDYHSSNLTISELIKKKIADEHLICFSVTPNSQDPNYFG